MDLRRRRKIETTRLIHEAAVALARDTGVEAVTIEAICAAVGVSQRTFFNYFPFKEAAFVFPPPPLPTEAAARFVAGTDAFMPDLIDLMVAQSEEMAEAPWIGPLMREINEAYPRLMPLQMAEFQKFERELQGLIARRLGLDADDAGCAALAGAVIGTGRTAVDRWRDDKAVDLPTLMRQHLEAVVKIIRSGVGD
jgi:AcrR family transcriptional regulator